jgi:hypothetical protein
MVLLTKRRGGAAAPAATPALPAAGGKAVAKAKR